MRNRSVINLTSLMSGITSIIPSACMSESVAITPRQIYALCDCNSYYIQQPEKQNSILRVHKIRRVCIYNFFLFTIQPESDQRAQLDLRDGIKTIYSYVCVRYAFWYANFSRQVACNL